MPIQPSEETSFIVEIILKITGVFISFVGGIVTATWVVAGKIKGFDDRLKSTEDFQAKVDAKLDRIHDRIDEALLRGRE